MLEEIIPVLIANVLHTYFHIRNASTKKIFFATFFCFSTAFIIYALFIIPQPGKEIQGCFIASAVGLVCALVITFVIVVERSWYLHKQASKKTEKIE